MSQLNINVNNSIEINKQIQQIKQKFNYELQKQSNNNQINYYDFLLVAKKMSFRFEQSSHLMELKNIFIKNNNYLSIHKLVQTICINRQSLQLRQDKIIVKFNVPTMIHFAPIKQVTNEDEDESYNISSQQLDINNNTNNNNYNNNLIQQQQSISDLYDEKKIRMMQNRFQGIQFYRKDDPNYNDNNDNNSRNNNNNNDEQINEKILIILAIKMQEMQRKLKYLINIEYPFNIFNIFKQQQFQQQQQQKIIINFDLFRKKILQLLIFNSNDKLKLSQSDIKTIFYILDQKHKFKITFKQLQKLKNLEYIFQNMKQFYRIRINRQMVKNTLFKLGKTKNHNSIQVYQLKSASLLEFQNMQQLIVNNNNNTNNNYNKKDEQNGIKKTNNRKIPHFGPLKGTSNMLKLQNKSMTSNGYHTQQNIQHKTDQISRERQKIQKILRCSKDEKHQKSSHTVASKLRSLFIHKVILPRQKMLEQQKQRYNKPKNIENQLSIRPLK